MVVPKLVSLCPNLQSRKALRGRGSTRFGVAEALSSEHAPLVFSVLGAWIEGSLSPVSQPELVDMAATLIPLAERANWRIICDVCLWSSVPSNDETIFIDGSIPLHLKVVAQQHIDVLLFRQMSLSPTSSPVPPQEPPPPPMLVEQQFFAPALPLVARLV